MAYPAYAVTNTFSNGTLADADEVNTNFTEVENIVNGASALGVPSVIGMAPVGSVIAWHKTLREVSSTGGQTNTSTSATQLIDTAADFVSDGVTAGMIVHNEDDNEFAIVETVVDLNTLTLVSDLNAGTADVDTFSLATGINYAIYATPELPDNWLECNGQTVSDADSPFNGVTLPALNGTSDSTKKYLSGISGATGTISSATTHTHNTRDTANYASGGLGGRSDNSVTEEGGNLPPTMEIAWIIRVK